MTDPKHETLNPNVRNIQQSATLAIKAKVRAMRREGTHVYDFGLGQSPFPVPRQVVESLRLHASEKDYLPVEGLPALREAVSRYHRRQEGVNVQPENVLVGPGSKELLFLVQLTFFGDIVVPTPSWVSYVPQARIVGRTVQHVKTKYENRWQLTPDDVVELCERGPDATRPRLLVLNYPANPHGCSYTSNDLQALAKVAREYGIIILSDEIYGELHHDGEHVSIARHYPEGTIISNGISKWCGAGGWRLGTFTFPDELDWLRTSMGNVASETYTSVSAPIQYAAVKAFQGGASIERYLWRVRRILKTLGRQGTEILTDAGVRVHAPDGGFYLFPDFGTARESLAKHGITTSQALCRSLLDEAGVAVLPGSDFERPSHELTTRLAYVNLDGARALTASETIPLDQELPAEFVARYCQGAVEGFEAMARWMKERQ